MISVDGLKLLLKHYLAHLAVGCLNIHVLFVTTNFFTVLNGHLALCLNALNITAVSCLKVRVVDQVVDINELKLILFASDRKILVR
jgi:hypothetical protein